MEVETDGATAMVKKYGRMVIITTAAPKPYCFALAMARSIASTAAIWPMALCASSTTESGVSCTTSGTASGRITPLFTPRW